MDETNEATEPIAAEPQAATEPSAVEQPPAAPPATPSAGRFQTDATTIVRIRALRERISTELAKVIVGQTEVVDQLLVSILCGGHCLFEGVPGLAKTLLISSLAQTIDLSFKRIQFTPDLMPSDITGTDVVQEDPATGERRFKFLAGPIFANIILADEINRTPPKTQAALLEAMQEHQVSIGGEIHALPRPFFVLATQNPIDQEGTYPLPEAQQDRFFFKILVDYPTETDETEIVRRVTEGGAVKVESVCGGPEILEIQQLIRAIPVADAVIDYARNLVRATRIHRPEALEFVNNWLSWGAGPRATINLISAAKGFCAINGRPAVSCDDVAQAAHPVLRHRLAVNYTAKAEGRTTDDVITKLLESCPKY